MFFKRRKNNTKVPNENYKRECELTKEDYEMIDIDRMISGIEYYSDEYYYNNFLFYNYKWNHGLEGVNKMAKCPYCGKNYYRELYSTSTCLYCSPVYKDGKLINNEPNTTTTHCHCLNCNKDFSYNNK